MLAIYQALRRIKQFYIRKSVIISDCRSALELLRKPSFFGSTPYLVILIKLFCVQLLDLNFKFSFVWCPSHVGIVGNEHVDQLAKEALITGDETRYLPPSCDLAPKIKLKLKTEWNNEWLESSSFKGSALFKIQPKISLSPWFKNLSFNRKSIVTISRLRTGHNSLPSHLHRIKVIDSSSCVCGYSLCDANHLLFACPLLENQRQNLFVQLIKLKTFPPYCLSSLLASFNPKIYNLIISFFQLL
jgi:hypothetical protein